LSAGKHRLRHPLEISKPLSLIGEGSGNTSVLGDGDAYVVKFVGNGPFVVHELRFKHEGSQYDEGSQYAPVVDVDAGQIDIRSCVFHGGAGRSPIGAEVGSQGGSGLRLRGQTRGSVANCISLENTLAGILIEEQAHPIVEGSVCTHNAAGGIAVSDQAHPILKDNSCHHNSSNGIYVGEQAQPTLESNDCGANWRSGIAYFGSAASIARHNTCSSIGRNGIRVSEQAQPRVAIGLGATAITRYFRNIAVRMRPSLFSDRLVLDSCA